jgi:hypothetical protein
MDKAMIIGIYEFIGFHLGQYLLEQGIEVIGIHIPTDDRDPFLEEKRLFIGRNANFTEEDAKALSIVTSGLTTDVTVIDYYSFYMKRQEEELISAIEESIWPKENDSVIFLMPVQLYEDEGMFNHSVAFYLPTIYGPWQPANFLFHQALFDPKSTIEIDEREWTEDALYIDDAVKMIVGNVQPQQRHILLKSNIKDHWRMIMMMVMKHNPLQPSNQPFPLEKNLTVLKVDGIDPREGIERQKSHMDQLSR